MHIVALMDWKCEILGYKVYLSLYTVMNGNYSWIYAVHKVREQRFLSISTIWSYDNRPVEDGNSAEIFVNYFPT